MVIHTCKTKERHCPAMLQVLIVLFDPDKAKEFLGIELPGSINTWPSVRDTRLLDKSDFSYFTYLLCFASFFYSIPSFSSYLNIQKNRRKK